MSYLREGRLLFEGGATMTQCQQPALFEKVQYQGHAVITVCSIWPVETSVDAEEWNPVSLKNAATLSE